MSKKIRPARGTTCIHLKCKWRHLVANFATNASGTIWLTNASGILICWRDNSSFRCYTLGPLCLCQNLFKQIWSLCPVLLKILSCWKHWLKMSLLKMWSRLDSLLLRFSTETWKERVNLCLIFILENGNQNAAILNVWHPLSMSMWRSWASSLWWLWISWKFLLSWVSVRALVQTYLPGDQFQN